MAFATKYNLTFKDWLGTQWDIDFQVDGFSGDVTDLIGTGDPVFINYEANEHFTHSPIKSSSVEINLIESTDDAYVEFFTSDKAAKVKIYRGSDLFWQGWTIATGYHSPYNVPPKSVRLYAIDGLAFLKNIPLDPWTLASLGPGKNSLMEYIKQALNQIGFSTNLYESLQISELGIASLSSSLTDLYVDSWRWYRKGTGVDARPGWGVYDNTEVQPYDNLYNVLDHILTALGARIYQKDGCWYIDHISQLSGGSITYHSFNSSYAKGDDAAETRDLDITAKGGSPQLVPINHSLYKEFDRPYSEFTLGINTAIDQNLLRYDDIFTPLNTGYTLTEETIEINGISNEVIREGIVYNCGHVDFTGSSLDEYVLKLNVSGRIRGVFSAAVYFHHDNASFYIYPKGYKGPGEHFSGLTYTDGEHWPVFNLAYPDTLFSIVKHSDKDSSDNYILSDFSEALEIIGTGSGMVGTLYLEIFCPYISGATGAFLEIDRTNFSLKYENARANTKKYKLTSSNFIANTGSVETEIHSRFLYYSVYVNPSGGRSTSLISDENVQLLYPGLIYWKNGSDYIPAVNFTKGDTDPSLLEYILMEDIMTFYSVLRRKLTGTLMGLMNFGNVLDYDNRRYMIVSDIFNIKKSQHEVTLLQVSDLAAYLLNEDGTYILDEDGNKIVL